MQVMEADWEISSNVLRAELSQAVEAYEGGFDKWKGASNVVWAPAFFQSPQVDGRIGVPQRI
jgi:hypothetical protein